MYSLVEHNVPPALVEYLKQPHIQSIDFNGQSYVMNGVRHGGLLRKLQAMHYPHFNRTRRRHTKTRVKKGSSIAEGKAVDAQLTKYVESGRKPRKAEAKAIIEFLEGKHQMRIVAAQVPVYVKSLNRVTQADLIVEDKTGNLLMMEIKCGYNQMQKQGDLKGLPGVPCRQKEIWELQRHYTHQGLCAEGLKIIGSHILNVYKEGRGNITVQQRKVPKWALTRLV